MMSDLDTLKQDWEKGRKMLEKILHAVSATASAVKNWYQKALISHN